MKVFNLAAPAATNCKKFLLTLEIEMVSLCIRRPSRYVPYICPSMKRVIRSDYKDVNVSPRTTDISMIRLATYRMNKSKVFPNNCNPFNQYSDYPTISIPRYDSREQCNYH